MDAVESTSPPSLRHKLRTTVCVCFGSPSSPGSHGERPQSGGRARWRRRVAAAGEFRYDQLSYALNFDDRRGSRGCGLPAQELQLVPASLAGAGLPSRRHRLKSFAASVAFVSLIFLLLQVRLSRSSNSSLPVPSCIHI
ncbi:hypothetical protein VPH35_132590 [Triticum aestivum]